MLNIFGSVKCDVCNKSISFLENYDKTNDMNENLLTVCLDCREKLWNEEKNNRNAEIVKVLEKYYCSQDQFKRMLLYSMNNIRASSIDIIVEAIKNMSEKNNSDVETKRSCNVLLEIVDDMNKLEKIFKKKNITVDCVEMLGYFQDFATKELENNDENMVNIEYYRIKNILSGKEVGIESIIAEFIKSPVTDEKELFLVKKIIQKFNIDFQDDLLESKFNDIKDDIELEEFEQNMGNKTKNHVLEDYSELSGYDFETFLKKLFEVLGYTVVQTKLSGDQGADLIMMNKNRKVVVQAKKYSGSVTNKAIQEVVASKLHYKCDDALVVTTGFFTKGAMELAMSNNVELWDGTKLKETYDKINFDKKKEIIKTVDSSDFYNCPVCNYEIKNYDKQTMKITEEETITCPQCKIGIKKKAYYFCNGCQQKFSISEWDEHINNCQQLKEKMFICPKCSKEIILEERELDEYQKTNTINTQCPYDECREKIVMDKSNSKYFS